MDARAIVIEEPRKLALCDLSLQDPTDHDVVVDIETSGISTGTEKLLWSGRMPMFPGMGYPLVPGYESVGRVVEAGRLSGRAVGQRVFIPGANCYRDVRGLFGGAASRVVVAGRKAARVDETLGERAILLALAATAHHAVRPDTRKPPELIVGHGVLGRLVARIAVGSGGGPAGSSTHRAAYAMMPEPPMTVATTKAARTASTGTPRCAARPDATPPIIGSRRSRQARRTSRGGAGGADRVAVLVMMDPSSHSAPRASRGKDPEPTLMPTPGGCGRIRAVPDGPDDLHPPGLRT